MTINLKLRLRLMLKTLTRDRCFSKDHVGYDLKV